MELSVGCWAKIGPSSEHMIISAVRRRVGGSWIVGVSVVNSFEFCSVNFLFFDGSRHLRALLG